MNNIDRLAQWELGRNPPAEDIMDQVKTDPLLGRDIAGRYRIEEKIGEGGMGSVYRARNIVTGKVVAIKVLLEDLAAYDSFVQRFLHEAQAAAYLNHPHAINIIDCGRDGAVVYLLMEYVEGRTLTEVMRGEGPFPVERAANILRQTCAAVAEAHSQSIVHRDLKPDNIMLQRVAGGIDYVKVLDFGIAKVLDNQKRENAPVSRNIFVGTPEYASPEQCNAKDPTHLSDIYSLGAIAYEMLTGAPPFSGDPMEVMLKQVNESPRPVRQIRPDLSPDIEKVLKRALSKDPARRQQHALQLAQEFEAAVYGGVEEAWDLTTPGRDSVPVRQYGDRTGSAELITLPPKPRVWSSLGWLFRTRKRRWVFALVTIAVLGGIGAGYQFYRWYRVTPVLPAPPRLVLPPLPSMPPQPLAHVKQLIEEGNRDEAVSELKRILESDQGFNPEAHRLLGQVYLDQGDYASAESQLTTAIKQMEGEYPEAQYLLGQLLLQRGDEAKAINQFGLAAENKSRPHLPSLVALAELASRQGESDKADETIRKVIASASDDPEDVVQVGRVLLLKKQYDLAGREFRRAIAAKQDMFPGAELYLGLALAQQANLKDAVDVLTKAVAHRGGNYPAGRLALGSVLYQLDQYERAIEELKAAIRLRGGNYPEAELTLGTVLADWAVGQSDEAMRQLQLAVTHRGGSFPEAEQALARLYFARLGQLAEARKIWTRLEDQKWLDQTKEAVVIKSAAGVSSQRIVGGTPLDPDESLTFALSPLANGTQAPTITIEAGTFGLKLRLFFGEEKRPVKWKAVALTPEGERPLDVRPVDNELMGKVSAEVIVRITRSQVSLTINGHEAGRISADLPVPVLAIINDGSAVLYNVRESKSVDNR